MTRETLVTTALGILLGIATGAVVSYQITRSIETAFVQYNRDVSVPAWGYGMAITALFAFIINAIVLRKVRHLKLTDMTS